jgi:hypothetical protein
MDGNDFQLLRSNAAGTHNAPVGNGLEDGEQAHNDRNKSNPPKHVSCNNDTCNKANSSDDSAGHAARAVEVRSEKSTHKNWLCLTTL